MGAWTDVRDRRPGASRCVHFSRGGGAREYRKGLHAQAGHLPSAAPHASADAQSSRSPEGLRTLKRP